jgi:hypothetical protein
MTRRLILVLVVLLALAVPTTAQAPVTASGTISTLDQAVTISNLGPNGAVGVQLTGSCSSGVVSFEGTIDGSAWSAIEVVPIGSQSAVTTASAAGVWIANVGGLAGVRARISDACDANTFTASLRATPASARLFTTTQPVSGTITANAGSGTFTVGDGSGSLTVDGTVAATQSGTWSVRNQDGSGNNLTSKSAGSERALSIAVVDSAGNQISTFGGSGGTAQSDNTSLGSITGIGALYDTTPPSVTDGNVAAPVMDSSRRLIVNCGVGCSGSSFADNSAFTFGTTAIGLSGGVLDDTSPNAATENSAALARISSNRNWYFQLRDGLNNERGASVTAANALKVDNSGVTQPISGTVTANVGTARADTSTTDTITALDDTTTLAIAPGRMGVTATVSGTYTATLVPEVSIDSGSSWLPTYWVVPQGDGVFAGTMNPGSYTRLMQLVPGATHVRVRASAYTSGTATVTIQASDTPGLYTTAAVITEGDPVAAMTVVGGQDGSDNGQALRVATTTPGASDKGLIVREAARGQATMAASIPVTLASNQSALPVTDNSGSLTVDNAGTFAVQAAQSGTWNVTNISGTVSLPTGASTLAEQQTQTTALQKIDNLAHSGADVALVEHVPISAQFDDTSTTTVTENQIAPLRITSGRALHVAQQGTATVSGTVTANAGSGTMNVETELPAGAAGTPVHVRPSDGSTAQTFHQADADTGAGTVDRIFTGIFGTASGGPSLISATGTSLNVNCTGGCTPGGSFNDNTAFTFGTTAVNVAGYVFDDTSPNTVTENNAAAPRMSANRVPYAQLRDAAGNERGANVTAGNELEVSIDNVTPATASGTISALNNAVTLAVGGYGAVGVQLTGTCTAGSVAFETTVDGTNWSTLLLNPVGATGNATGATAAGIWAGPVGGMQSVRARISDACDANNFTATLRATVADGREMAFEVSVANTPTVQAEVTVFPDNQPINVAQFGGSAVVTGTGASGSGVPRVTVANDSSVIVGTFPDNEPINVAVTMGNGAAGTGVQRVTIANDSTGILASVGSITTSVTPGTAAANLGKAEDASVGSGDTGIAALLQREDTPASTASANNEYISAKANLWGHQFTTTMCSDPNLTTSIAISQTALNGNAQLVALTTNETIYVCGYDFVVSAAASVRLVYGTGSACATGETGLTGAYPFSANGGIVKEPKGAMKTAVSNALCIETSASVDVMGSVQYVKFQ